MEKEIKVSFKKPEEELEALEAELDYKFEELLELNDRIAKLRSELASKKL